MPRDTGTRIICVFALAGAALTLVGCNSSQNALSDGMYAQYFRMVRQSFAASFGDQKISREDAAAIPYASLGYRVDGGPQNLLVLATDTNGNLLWTAKSRVVILTHDGRIGRTVGLARDIAAVTPRNGQPLPAPSSALGGPVSSARLADFPDISAYGVPLTCSAAAAGPESITILGNVIRTVRVDESCRSAGLRWSYVDKYWIEPQSGLVWRSLQHIHPKGETVETEIFRPPG